MQSYTLKNYIKIVWYEVVGIFVYNAKAKQGSDGTHLTKDPIANKCVSPESCVFFSLH